MPSKYWIKLYHEILDDPKMGQMTEVLFARCIKLFLLAGDFNEDGLLPSISDVAWRLRINEDELKDTYSELQKVGILLFENDTWIVKKFADRQKAMTPAKKMRLYRETKKENEYYDQHYTGVTNGVTDSNTDIDKNRSDKKLDKEEEPNGTNVPTNLDGWLEQVKNGKNKQAALMWMFDTLYPRATEKPDFAYIGRVAKNVGGAGRLAALFWECSGKQITGDVMQYVQGYSKNHKGKPTPKDREAELKRMGYGKQ